MLPAVLVSVKHSLNQCIILGCGTPGAFVRVLRGCTYGTRAATP